MATEPRAGNFYEFDLSAIGKEIRGFVSRNTALQHLRNKKDIYTLQQSDAKSLAKAVQKGKADRDPPHKDGYFKHFHPAGDHETYGHVFYGKPGPAGK